MRLIQRAARAASVSESKPAIQCTATPLKVFVYTPGQDEVRADFAGWLGEWNQSDGGKCVRLEAAEDASQADIILARFVFPLTTEREPRNDTNIADMGGAVRDPATGRAMSIPKAPARAYYSAKVYCYVIGRDAGGLKVLWRVADSIRIYHGVKAGGGNYKNLKARKDSRSAGDSLRNKFFEMMKATPRT
ncbi:MAG: hypothetical protein M3444_10270 [Acidobacteriota bacterium]|nr:hypothetical protein [Acidobacteriota bacterium]MDQ5838133.1 hypothetical protein [Acidobacteriota bacterium]